MKTLSYLIGFLLLNQMAFADSPYIVRGERRASDGSTTDLNLIGVGVINEDVISLVLHQGNQLNTPVVGDLSGNKLKNGTFSAKLNNGTDKEIEVSCSSVN